MKISLFYVWLFFWANVVFSQLSISEIDQRLLDVYGKNRIEQLLVEHPQFVSYMNFYVQNGYYIMENIPERKLSYFKDFTTIRNKRTGSLLTYDDINNLNILLLDIKRKQDEHLTYKLGDTGTVVIFIAPASVLQQYRDLKKTGGIR